MADESTSKKEIFKDVRFFLAEENNEEVCVTLFISKRNLIARKKVEKVRVNFIQHMWKEKYLVCKHHTKGFALSWLSL